MAEGECVPPLFPKREERVGERRAAEQIQSEGYSFVFSTKSTTYPQADIAAVMCSILTGRPVSSNELEELGSAVLPGRGAGAVEAVFFGFLEHLAATQFFLLPPHGDELPASAQSGFFGAEADALQAPPDQPAVFLGPAGVVFRGKKKLWVSGFGPARGCRFGCL